MARLLLAGGPPSVTPCPERAADEQIPFMRPRRTAASPMRSATLLALVAMLPLAACDTYDDHFHDDDDDAYVRVIDFEIDGDDYSLSSDTRYASFDTGDIRSSSDRDAVRDALRFAGDGALVLLYADNELFFEFTGDSRPYTALPVTYGYETLDGSQVVEYTVTYTFAFDNQDLYFDVISSARSDTFGDTNGALFDAILPGEIDLRLVTLEADVVTSKQAEVAAKTGGSIDYRNYEEVKAVFGLPD